MTTLTLAKLQVKYGPDFLKKLPRYKTAYRGQECVALVRVDVAALLAIVRDTKGKETLCSICELDNFVL